MTFSGQQPVRPQADWLQQLTDIRQLMAEQAAELDRSGDFPHHNLAHLHQRGFLSLATPAQYGGAATGDYRHCVGRTGDGADRLYAVSASSASGG